MLVRKVPGFVPASPWGLRLPQKFLFLLFLSGLVTLCFGALFLLPHSSRLKRLFSASRTQQPGLEVMAEITGHHPLPEREPPPNPAPAAPAPGEDDPGRPVGALHRKGWPRRTRPTGPREEGDSVAAPRLREESVRFSFDYTAFRSRLRHPVLGTRTDESKESQSLVRAQREKIKEVSVLRHTPPDFWLQAFPPSRPLLAPGLPETPQAHCRAASLPSYSLSSVHTSGEPGVQFKAPTQPPGGSLLLSSRPWWAASKSGFWVLSWHLYRREALETSLAVCLQVMTSLKPQQTVEGQCV